jgi:inosine-uridine nucleoside N-ribohydrolase
MFPKLTESQRIQALNPPQGKISMVLDTDTYNEIDDQFAVVYSLLADELEVEAIYAAPFQNFRSNGPGDGMERSYEEILRLLERLDHSPENFVYRGSDTYLPAANQPVESDAARNLVERAMADREGPLYVLPIGAITNIASAILIEPAIIERIVVVWLGGHPHNWRSTNEFNLGQDIHASRLIFDCGVPFVQIPCKNVAEHLRTTMPEMERYVKGKGAIGDYLFEIFTDYGKDKFAWSKVIWDISTVAWLINPDWIPTVLTHSPILTDQITFSHDPTRHLMRVAIDANRDAVFGDLFKRLEGRG